MKHKKRRPKGMLPKKRRMYQNGGGVGDPPQGTITPQEALMRALQPENQFRLTGGDAPFRPIKEQRDPVETLGRGIAEAVRMLPFAGEAIDTYELGKVAATGEDVYGQEQDPAMFAGMTAAGYLIPNILEKPLKSAWRAVKKFPAKLPKKEFRELPTESREAVLQNLTQAHREVYESQLGMTKLTPEGEFYRIVVPRNIRQLPSLMSGSKLENAVGKDGLIQVSQIENLIKSKDLSAVEREALEEVMQTEAFQSLREMGGGNKVDYNKFRDLTSGQISIHNNMYVERSKKYADYGIDNLGLNQGKDAENLVRISPSPDIARADDVGLARTNLIKHNLTDLMSDDYGHFGQDVIGHYRTFDRPDEKGVLYISELQADPLQARGYAGEKRVGLDIGEGGPTTKQANLIKNQDQFLISHILENEAKGADKLRFPTGETTAKIQGYGDIIRNVQRAERDLAAEQGALDGLMVDLDTATGKEVPSRIARHVDAMGLSGVDPDKTIDFLAGIRALRNRRNLAPDAGSVKDFEALEKFDNDALRQAYKEIKEQFPSGPRFFKLEEAAEDRAIDIKESVYAYGEQLAAIMSSREHLSRVNASTQATQGIMKGYDRLPKALKKHGLDATKVTDDVGNTWWEVDIPARLGEGVGEIRAYKKGGKFRILKK
jgi:hypothetical protein